MAEYLPFCKIVEQGDRCPEVCRDEKDQPFLDLAQSGKAEALVSGDKEKICLRWQDEPASSSKPRKAIG